MFHGAQSLYIIGFMIFQGATGFQGGKQSVKGATAFQGGYKPLPVSPP